jgi:hypothetical protein
MPTVRRGINQHIVTGGSNAAIQRNFQRFVTRLTFLERQIITEIMKRSGRCGDQFHDIR